MTRDLLDSAGVAAKLNLSVESFRSTRERLYAQGFPPPVFGNSRYGHGRWDPAAIDRWLDTRMPKHLRYDEKVNAKPFDLVEWEGKLEARLK